MYIVAIGSTTIQSDGPFGEKGRSAVKLPVIPGSGMRGWARFQGLLGLAYQPGGQYPICLICKALEDVESTSYQ